MTKPHIVKYVGDVWHCRSPEYWGCGYSPQAAYTKWRAWMKERYAQ